VVVIVGKVKVLDVLSLASVKMKAPVPPLTLNIVDVAVLATTAAGVNINVSASTITVAVPETPRESIAVTVAEPAMVLAVKSPVEATMFPIEVADKEYEYGADPPLATNVRVSPLFTCTLNGVTVKAVARTTTLTVAVPVSPTASWAVIVADPVVFVAVNTPVDAMILPIDVVDIVHE